MIDLMLYLQVWNLLVHVLTKLCKEIIESLASKVDLANHSLGINHFIVQKTATKNCIVQTSSVFYLCPNESHNFLAHYLLIHGIQSVLKDIKHIVATKIFIKLPSIKCIHYLSVCPFKSVVRDSVKNLVMFKLVN